jgi:hypothetical protein
VQPFEYTAKVNTDGSVATLECYIHILSSQNENALFRLRIRALFPAGATTATTKKDKKAAVAAAPGETLEVFTEPIQVISKPSVLRRKHEREKAKYDDLVSTPANAHSSQKRSRDDVILETLAEIKRQQEQQQRLLETLTASPPSSPANAPSSSSYSSSPVDSAHSTPLVEPEPENFETAFKNCIRAYNNLDRDSRGGKVRKVLRELGAPGTAFAEAVWSESFQREIDAQVSRIALLDVPAASVSSVGWRETSWRLVSTEAADAIGDDFNTILPSSESAIMTN